MEEMLIKMGNGKENKRWKDVSVKNMKAIMIFTNGMWLCEFTVQNTT